MVAAVVSQVTAVCAIIPTLVARILGSIFSNPRLRMSAAPVRPMIPCETRSKVPAVPSLMMPVAASAPPMSPMPPAACAVEDVTLSLPSASESRPTLAEEVSALSDDLAGRSVARSVHVAGQLGGVVQGDAY